MQGQVEGAQGCFCQAQEEGAAPSKWVWGNKPAGLEVLQPDVLSGALYAQQKVSPLA